MFQRLSTPVWLSRLVPAGSLLAVVLVMTASIRAQVQQSQGKPPAPAQPSLVIAIAASEAADKEAIDAATKYFDDLKLDKKLMADEEKRAKAGQPPLYPNPPDEPPPPPPNVPANVAAAVALVPAGLGEQLLAGLALNHTLPKQTPPRYRWVALNRDRELRILGLKETGVTRKYWDEAKAAREAGKIYVHSRFSWPIYSRPGPGGKGVEFYLLVLEPGGDKVLTDQEIEDVRRPPTEPGILLFFTGEEGRDRLKAFTTAYKAEAGKPVRYLVITSKDAVVEIASVADVIPNGRMKLGTGLSLDDLDRLYRQLSRLTARKPTPNQ